MTFTSYVHLYEPRINLIRYRWNHGLAAASLSGTEGDDEDEDEGEEDGEEDTAGAGVGAGVGGGARGLRWKDALHDRAAAAFSRRQKTNVDLMALVYVIHFILMVDWMRFIGLMTVL